MNLYHDVSRGENTPNELNVIIEIPKNSNNKYEIDKETGLIALDRANYNGSAYPFDYGFVPQTLWADGDALDVVVITTYPLNLGVLVAVRPIAIMDMNDSGEDDAKIIAVPINDRRFDDINDLADLNKHTLKEISHFFETYKMLKADDPKKYPVIVSGFKGKKEAMEAVETSIKNYEDKYKK